MYLVIITLSSMITELFVGEIWGSAEYELKMVG